MLENNGIVPRVPVELSRDALMEGRDTQMIKAVELVTGCEPAIHETGNFSAPRERA